MEPQQPTTESKIDVKKITIAIVLAVLIILLPVFGYFFFNKNKKTPTEVKTSPDQAFKMKGAETGTQYLKENLIASQQAMTAELDALKNSNRFLYLSNNAIYTQSRVSLNITSYRQGKEVRDENFTQIYNDIYNIYQSLDENSLANNLTEENKKFIRSRYYYILNYMYDNASVSTLTNSKWYDSPDYKVIRSKYKDEILSSMLFMQKMSENTLDKTDNLQVAINLHSTTRILNMYSDQLEKKAVSLLVSDLKNKIDLYKKASETKMFVSPQYKNIVPSRYYVEAYALLAHFDKKAASKDVVDPIFQTAFSEFAKYAKSDKDVIYSVRLFDQFTYISYLFEMNNYKVNDEIITQLAVIEKYSQALAATPEVLSIFNSYVRSFSTAKQGDIFRTNILNISKQNDDFKRFLLKTSTSK